MITLVLQLIITVLAVAALVTGIRAFIRGEYGKGEKRVYGRQAKINARKGIIWGVILLVVVWVIWPLLSVLRSGNAR